MHERAESACHLQPSQRTIARRLRIGINKIKLTGFALHYFDSEL